MTNISYDYIRGLVQGTGSFTFTTSTKLGSLRMRRIPTFQLRTHASNQKLLGEIRDLLDLKNKIYTYHYPGKDRANRKPVAILLIREFSALKNVIIPLFYGQLVGDKADEFNDWLKKIESDHTVPKSYKLFYRLYKSGYYERELCRGGSFEKFVK